MKAYELMERNISGDSFNINEFNSRTYQMRDAYTRLAALEIKDQAAKRNLPRPQIYLPFTLVFLY